MATLVGLVGFATGCKDGNTLIVAPEDLSGVQLTPSPITVATGDSVQVVATVTNVAGAVIPDPSITWTSGNPTIAEVDEYGLVFGVAEGATILLARASEDMSAVADVLVGPANVGLPARVEVWPLNPELTIGGTARITAVVYDEAGVPIESAVVTWSSSDGAVVSVDPTGLISAKGRGTATVMAIAGSIMGSITVTVTEPGAGEDEGLGNNLSWPVVFAEGYGLTGQPTSSDAGLRPTVEEAIPVTEMPFFAATNVADYPLNGVDYYMQKGTNTWQAEWLDGTGEVRGVEVKWGDNVTHHTFSTHSQIRVEVALSSFGDAPLTGYNMTHLYGERSTEMQGTDGTTGEFVPALFTTNARLRIEKLDNATFQPVLTLFDGSIAEGLASEGPGTFGVEVNVAGKLIYGYNMRVQDYPIPAGIDKYGWWRLTFSLDDQAAVGGNPVARGARLERCGNAPLEGEEPLVYSPALDVATQRSVLDIWIASAKGSSSHGGGSGGGHTDGGGCGDH